MESETAKSEPEKGTPTTALGAKNRQVPSIYFFAGAGIGHEESSGVALGVCRFRGSGEPPEVHVDPPLCVMGLGLVSRTPKSKAYQPG
ncbi:hypothetical protein H5410_013816 [Solanum commersonii]|uniref:Uncharacterized protein n=1 Tax=Solanum commersonii TaxID=4109 RepID=A0A9J5ZP97_SOLCO|nr:hypothetical protein H5410_013816 [Solanum commersonii]